MFYMLTEQDKNLAERLALPTERQTLLHKFVVRMTCIQMFKRKGIERYWNEDTEDDIGFPDAGVFGTKELALEYMRFLACIEEPPIKDGDPESVVRHWRALGMRDFWSWRDGGKYGHHRDERPEPPRVVFPHVSVEDVQHWRDGFAAAEEDNGETAEEEVIPPGHFWSGLKWEMLDRVWSAETPFVLKDGDGGKLMVTVTEQENGTWAVEYDPALMTESERALVWPYPRLAAEWCHARCLEIRRFLVFMCEAEQIQGDTD